MKGEDYLPFTLYYLQKLFAFLDFEFLPMGFLIALQFLTIIPISIKRQVNDEELAQTMIFFPIVGVALGLAILCIQTILYPVFPIQVVSIILIMALIILTGGLHLDGLADTIDALFSGQNKEGKLQIMKDSHIGVMGTVAITLVLLLKITLLNSIPHRFIIPTLILFPVVGRCGMLLPAYIFKYARREGGTGKVFISNLKLWTLLSALFLTFVISAGLLQIVGVIVVAIGLLVSLLVGWYIAAKIGGMTGDTLGAINECGEVIFLTTGQLLIF